MTGFRKVMHTSVVASSGEAAGGAGFEVAVVFVSTLRLRAGSVLSRPTIVCWFLCVVCIKMEGIEVMCVVVGEWLLVSPALYTVLCGHAWTA